MLQEFLKQRELLSNDIQNLFLREVSLRQPMITLLLHRLTMRILFSSFTFFAAELGWVVRSWGYCPVGNSYSKN